MAGLRAGDLDREIVLQTATRSQDADGAEILTWDAGETLWAEWVPGSTSEVYRIRQRLESYIDGAYRIYFRDEPQPDVQRIIGHDGRTYDLRPAIEIGRGEGWVVPVIAHGETA